MIPVRHFVVHTLQFFACVILTCGLVGGFAFTYSYLGGNHEDRAEIEATIGQLLRATASVRVDR